MQRFFEFFRRKNNQPLWLILLNLFYLVIILFEEIKNAVQVTCIAFFIFWQSEKSVHLIF